ncbi:hypothetical protein E3N88_27365 [Mikania micrantha]|uniref:Uncharacterized protein n=1 Tax=Mikania micrantha TaxID=192012 RepID=A0A5N6MY01_9ASTR|nr:hypothetical protein E3N88_27365 [Mikania micrantha]
MVAHHNEYARPMLTAEHVLSICNSRQLIEDYASVVSVDYLHACRKSTYVIGVIDVDRSKDSGYETAVKDGFWDEIDVKTKGFETTVEHGFWDEHECIQDKLEDYESSVIGVIGVDRSKDSGYEKADECIQDKVENHEFSPFAIRFAALGAIPNEHARPMLTAEHVLCICNSSLNVFDAMDGSDKQGAGPSNVDVEMQDLG